MSNTYHFTREQINELLFATIGMYLEFLNVHGHSEEASLLEAVDEMFQGLDADRELAENDATEKLRLQIKAPGTLNATLLSACHDLHALLWHYDLARQPNGVDWGEPDILRREWIAALEALFAKAGQL